MRRTGRKQIKLGRTQPSFPDGWVLAVLDAWRGFAVQAGIGPELPKKSRSANRMRSGLAVEPATSEVWESRVTALVTALFPRVSGINGFAGKYVQEYFGLWHFSAEGAPRWVQIAGTERASASVLARAMFRDLLLRLCYLESCERRLAGRTESLLLQHGSFEAVYRTLIERRKPECEGAEEELAAGLKVSSRTIRRWQSGGAVPSFQNLCNLGGAGDRGLLGGIGFTDRLLRGLGLRESSLAGEVLPVGGKFLREHAVALEEFRGEGKVRFEEFASFKDNLLLHPGWQRVHDAMPDPLWRAHLWALCYAQPFELAQLYLRFAKPATDQPLVDALGATEGTDGHR